MPRGSYFKTKNVSEGKRFVGLYNLTVHLKDYLGLAVYICPKTGSIKQSQQPLIEDALL